VWPGRSVRSRSSLVRRDPPDALPLVQHLVSQHMHLIHLQHPRPPGFPPEVYVSGLLNSRAANGSVFLAASPLAALERPGWPATFVLAWRAAGEAEVVLVKCLDYGEAGVPSLKGWKICVEFRQLSWFAAVERKCRLPCGP
jgi:hypothetical protein